MLAGFSGGVFAESATEQLKDSSSGKEVSAPAATEATLFTGGNATCSPESAQADYISKLTRYGNQVTNLKLNTATKQIGNNKPKIVIIGSFNTNMPFGDTTENIYMAGYAFYDAATCSMEANTHTMLHTVK